jgi:hypothetical protein
MVQLRGTLVRHHQQSREVRNRRELLLFATGLAKVGNPRILDDLDPPAEPETNL